MSHVMLVEDHACFRQALGMELRQYTDFGISTQAGSLAEGRACLSADKAEQIDAAIIDIRLPDGNGADLIGEIGALRAAARRIPMMVLTEIQDPRLHDRWRGLGAVEVVSKAASLEDVLAAARRLGRNLGDRERPYTRISGSPTWSTGIYLGEGVSSPSGQVIRSGQGVIEGKCSL